jgi:hypothetical protein
MKHKVFGRYISVCRDKNDTYWFAKVNWAAIGPQTIKQTELFIKQLQRAVDFCKKLQIKGDPDE